MTNVLPFQSRPMRSDLQKAATLHLHYRQRYGTRETARILGIPTSTVHDWIKQGSPVIKNVRLRTVAQVAQDAYQARDPIGIQQTFGELARALIETDWEFAETIFPGEPDDEVPLEFADVPTPPASDTQDYPDSGVPPAPPGPSRAKQDYVQNAVSAQTIGGNPDPRLLGPGQQAPLTNTTPQIVYDRPPPLLDQLAAEAWHRFVNLLANDVPSYRAVKACKVIDPDFQPNQGEIARTFKALGKDKEPVYLSEEDHQHWDEYPDLILLANWSAGTVTPPGYVLKLYDTYEMVKPDVADLSLRLRDMAQEAYLEGLNAQLSALGEDPIGVITDPQVLYRIEDDCDETAGRIAETYNRDLGGAVYQQWIDGLATRGRQMSTYHLDNAVSQWAENRIGWKSTQVADTETTKWFNQAVKDFSEQNYSKLPDSEYFVTPDGCKCDGCKALVDGNPYTASEAANLPIPLHVSCQHAVLPVYSGQHYGQLWKAQEAEIQQISASEHDSIEQALHFRDVARDSGHGGDAQTLRDYWSNHPTKHGKVSGITWGVPGDFDMCVARVSKFMDPEKAKGYCSLRHKQATGFWPGHAPAEQAAKKAGGK